MEEVFDVAGCEADSDSRDVRVDGVISFRRRSSCFSRFVEVACCSPRRSIRSRARCDSLTSDCKLARDEAIEFVRC